MMYARDARLSASVRVRSTNVSEPRHLAARSEFVETGKTALRSNSVAPRRSCKVGKSLSPTGDGSGNEMVSCDIAADRRERLAARHFSCHSRPRLHVARDETSCLADVRNMVAAVVLTLLWRESVGGDRLSV